MVRKTANAKSVNVAPATTPDNGTSVATNLMFGSVTPSMASTVMDSDTDMDAQLEGTHLAAWFALLSHSTALSNAGSATESNSEESSVPWTVPTLSNGEQDINFTARACVGGVYSFLQEELQTIATDETAHGEYLAYAEYNRDFFGFPNNYGEHTVYRRIKGVDHIFTGFGEVQPPSEGTALGATGSHHVGAGGKVCCVPLQRICSNIMKVITDSTKVKSVIVVGPPTGASEKLLELYRSQIACPNDVATAEEIVDQVRVFLVYDSTDIAQGFNAKECVRTHSARSGNPGDLLVLVLQDRYHVRLLSLFSVLMWLKSPQSNGNSRGRIQRGTVPSTASDRKRLSLNFFA